MNVFSIAVEFFRNRHLGSVLRKLFERFHRNRILLWCSAEQRQLRYLWRICCLLFVLSTIAVFLIRQWQLKPTPGVGLDKRTSIGEQQIFPVMLGFDIEIK